MGNENNQKKSYHEKIFAFIIAGGGYAGGIWYTELPTMPCFVSESNEVTLMVAPNPASTFITVSVSEPLRNAELTIYDLQGKVCYSCKMQDDRYEISTCDFLTGIYFVKVVGDNASIVRKVAIQH